MEKGLLSRLQSYFKASFGGRYVEYLIKETIEEQPKLAKPLFGVKRSDRLQVEYPFRIGAQTRIADLAFFDAETERPTCLIEIKYDDHKNPKNAAQIKHYLKFCEKQKCKFIYLSQHLPPEDQRKLLPGRETLVLFSDLADKLKISEESVGGLLRRFFVDRGLVMHTFKDKDLANLKSLLFRLLNPWKGQGHSQNKDAMSGGVADAFGNLLRNMNIIAKEVATNESGRPPTVDFELDPWVKTKIVQKDAKEKPEAPSISALGAKDGGCLSVFGRIRLDDTATNWLFIEFGIRLQTNSDDKNLYPFTFAEIYSYAFRDDCTSKWKSASARILYDKPRAVQALKMRILEAIKHEIKRAPPKRNVAKLRKFLKNLR